MTATSWTADPAGHVYLDKRDYEVLSVESAIADDVIAERGYQTVLRSSAGEKQLRDCGIPRWAREPKTQRLPGLLIPVFRPRGELTSWRYRPWKPAAIDNGRIRKYAAPAGRASVVDVHPRNRDRVADPSVELWITEGHKKADALTSQGLCVAAIDGVFNWRSAHGTLGDWEDVLVRGRKVVVCFDADARDNRNVANAMARLGKWLDSKGAKIVRYLVVPGEVNGTAVKGVDDFLAAGGTLEQLKSVMESRPPNPLRVGDAFTDAKLAETITEDVLDGWFRWSAGLGWLAWNGTRWREAVDHEPVEAVRTYALERYGEAVKDGNRDAADGWHKVCTARRLRAITRLATGVKGVITHHSELDNDPDLLNVTNGVVDLTTGELLPHDPDLLMTKIAGCAYDPNATHPDWDAALKAVPPNTRRWLQERYGQGITGHMTPDDRLVIQHGGGENGKTTIMVGLTRVLQDYFLLVSDRVLLANPGDHSTELMDLRGVRFALIEETPEARRMNVQRLKKTVGTAQITARRIAKDPVTFDCTHTLFLSSNYRPIIEETDHGTWRRLSLVTYPYRFVAPPERLRGPNEHRGDPGLRDRLKSGGEGQHEAILAWLVGGAVRWYDDGKVMAPPPPTVDADTLDWRKESDQILAYVGDRLVFDTASHIASVDLLKDFNGWLATHGGKPWSEKLLASRFSGHDEVARHRVEKRRVRQTADGLSRPERSRVSGGIEHDLGKQYTAWLGVRFRTANDPADEAT